MCVSVSRLGLTNWNLIGRTDLLTALLSSAVHDDWRVDKGAGSGHVVSQQAFHFVGPQTDGQVEELHWSSWSNRRKRHSNDVSYLLYLL